MTGFAYALPIYDLGFSDFGAVIEFFRQGFGDHVADAVHQVLLKVNADLQQRGMDGAFDLRGEAALELCRDAVIEFFQDPLVDFGGKAVEDFVAAAGFGDAGFFPGGRFIVDYVGQDRHVEVRAIAEARRSVAVAFE